MKKKRRLQSSLLLGLTVLSLALVVTITAAVGLMYRRQMERQYSDMAFDTATIAANLIDGDRIPGYRETLQKDDYYEAVREQLQMIRRTAEVKYLYVVVPEDVQIYIWDTGDPNDPGVCDLGDEEAYFEGGYAHMHAAFAPDAEERMLITNTAEYGYLASAYYAILNSAGEPVALASVDVALDAINRQIDRFFRMILLLAGIIVLVSCVLYYFFIRSHLLRPIHTLDEETRSLVSDNINALGTFKNQIHTHDELQSLGESFEYMTRELDQYIRHLAEVTAEKERISAELNVATQIQADMLPRIFPPFPDRHEFDLFASMDPAKEVGGDFYDFFLVDHDHLALVIADVSGKGVPAALFMVITKTLIKNRAMMGDSPAQILNNVNAQLCSGNEANMFVTVWLAILDLSTGEGVAANAGHEHPAIRRKNGSFELSVYRHSPAVAALDAIRFKEHPFRLEPGDTLFVYTDGVTEATNANNELFRTDRMLDALNKDPDGTPEKLVHNVRDAIDTFVAGAPQFDDITMLGLRYDGPEGGQSDGGTAY